jgi:hypothetical protein
MPENDPGRFVLSAQAKYPKRLRSDTHRNLAALEKPINQQRRLQYAG